MTQYLINVKPWYDGQVECGGRRVETVQLHYCGSMAIGARDDAGMGTKIDF